MLRLPATRAPDDDGCWVYSAGRVLIDLSRAHELSVPGGALRLEGGELPFRVLVMAGADRGIHAFRNHCSRQGHRLDPTDGGRGVRCRCWRPSTYDLVGQVQSGPATEPLTVCPVHRINGRLVVTLQCRTLVRAAAQALNGQPLRFFV
jgi:nitrite reductase/ring-hydroxylating ferredoxin subunit